MNARLWWMWLSAVLLGGMLCSPARADDSTGLVVGSKKFPESVLLAELFAQLLEAKGLKVERRPNLGNTAVAFAALRQGNIDVYPEYSGTVLGLLELDRSKVDREMARTVVARGVEREFGLHWGPPLGFNNSYGLAVSRKTARAHHLGSLSDLASLSRQHTLEGALSHEFLSREDGYTPLSKLYRLHATVRGAEHGICYELISKGKVDFIDVYTTEGLIRQHDLTVLSDDLGFFPPYDASYLYGPRAAQSPRALMAFAELAGRLKDDRMRELNRQLEVDGLPVTTVARRFLSRFVEGSSAGTNPIESRKKLGFFELVAQDKNELAGHVARHLELTLWAMFLCILCGVPLGYAATRSRLAGALCLGATGILQTIPGLALLVFAIPVVGAVFEPLGAHSSTLGGAALLALFLYSLLPVVRNTKEGLEGVDPAVLDAATGLGMTRRQRFFMVTLPLALPVILAGVRTSFVITVGTATLAAFVGAGGLGVPILSGLSVQNLTEVWTGAVPAALLALIIDGTFALLQRRLTAGLR